MPTSGQPIAFWLGLLGTVGANLGLAAMLVIQIFQIQFRYLRQAFVKPHVSLAISSEELVVMPHSGPALWSYLHISRRS
jgi:hypothetical protein